MVFSLKVTKYLRSHILQLLDNESIPKEDKDIFNSMLKEETLTISHLKLIQKYSNEYSLTLDMKVLLEGSKLIFPSNLQVTKENKEVIARRQYLRRKQEEKEYNKMIYGSEINPNPTYFEPQAKDNPYTHMKNQVTISANMIISIFVMYGIGYMIGKSIFEEESKRMMCGLIGSIGIMIVEMALFIVRAVRMEQTYEKKTKIKKQE